MNKEIKVYINNYETVVNFKEILLLGYESNKFTSAKVGKGYMIFEHTTGLPVVPCDTEYKTLKSAVVGAVEFINERCKNYKTTLDETIAKCKQVNFN